MGLKKLPQVEGFTAFNPAGAINICIKRLLIGGDGFHLGEVMP